MLTKAMAIDLAESNIRVNAVAPGPIKTHIGSGQETRLGAQSELMVRALTPDRRWGEPDEIANAVLFLASEASSHITGTTIVVDGGYSAGNPTGQPWHPVADPGADLPWLKMAEDEHR